MRPKPQPGRRWTFAAALLLSVALASPLVAQQPGDTVEILIDVAFPQPEPPARVNDVIMVTGRSLGTVDIAGCGLGEHAVQQAILVDRDADRASRRIEFVFSSHSGELRPGARIATLSPTGTCTASGTTYNRYQGTLE